MGEFNVNKITGELEPTAGYGGYIKKTGSTISELVAVIDSLTNSQKIRAKIRIGNNVLTNYYISENYYGYNFVQASSNGPVVEYRLTKLSSTPQMQALTTNGTTTTISTVTITSWEILYQDDSPSGGNTYPASQVMLESGDSVEDVVDANDIGTAVLLTSYTTIDNPYIIPSDGYVELSGTSSGPNAVKIYSANNSNRISCTVAADTVTSVFVKKGMRVYCSSVTGSNIYYKPLQ